MKEDAKSTNFIYKIQVNILNSLLKFTIIFFHFSFVLTEESKKTLYVKTNGIINEMKIINSSNHIKDIFNKTNSVIYNDTVFKTEIEAKNGDQVVINLLKNKNETNISVGILLEIGNKYYDLDDSNFTVLFNEEEICDEYVDINIKLNDTFIKKNILYCYMNNSNETNLIILVPFTEYFHKNRLLEENSCNVENCIECEEGNPENCKVCDNNNGFYLYYLDQSCMSYDNIPSNCALDNDNIIKECYTACVTCFGIGSESEHKCTTCTGGLFIDRYEPEKGNCIEDDYDCPTGCSQCIKDNPELSLSRQCKKCSERFNYFPLEPYKDDQDYVICHLKTVPLKNYYLDENDKIYKMCYETCASCNTTGNHLNHSCLSCETNHQFIDEERCNCYPKCAHLYYYNKYEQYRCTDEYQCPEESPYLIADKSKCTDNCIDDDKYKCLYLNECLKYCPENTTGTHREVYGKKMFICVDNLTETLECQLNEVNLNNMDYKEITNERLDKYADDYMNEYFYSNEYVKAYSANNSDTGDSFLLILFKAEQCAKEMVKNYNPLGIDECIQIVKNQENIHKNLIVQIFYIYRRTYPRIKYNLYAPDTGKKLKLTECKNLQSSFQTYLFDNEEIDEELVRYFAGIGVNPFNLSDPFFTDICFKYSEKGKDVALADRIDLWFQNISLCDEDCACTALDLSSFTVNCTCQIGDIVSDDSSKSFLENPLSEEVIGFISTTNIDVLKCYKKVFFELDVLLNNYAALVMIGIFLIQFILSIAIKIQIKDVRNYIYSIINELSFPPKRIVNKTSAKKKDNKTEQKRDKSIEISPDIKIEKNSFFSDRHSNQINSTININKNNESNNNNVLGLSNNKSPKDDPNNEIFEVNQNSFFSNGQKDSKSDIDNVYYDPYYNKNKAKMGELARDIGNDKFLKIDNDVVELRNHLMEKAKAEERRKELLRKMKKNQYVVYEYKEYDEKEINELEFEKALIHDKRNCCQMFAYTLKQRQFIVNTFCAKEELKPFSIKLLFMIFNFTCYFVINGFFYNEEYISKMYHNGDKTRTLYEYFEDSIERILYASLAGGFISFIIGIVFETDKKIEDAMEKDSKNKILLRGKISKIYKCNIIVLTIFIICQFFVMAFFTVYISCFCYIYSNIMLDWIESSLIVIGIIQSFSFFASIFISFVKYLGVRGKCEICYKFNSYLDENL